jgi:hypothetical protein
MTHKLIAPKGKKIIFRPWITDPNGKRRYARSFGLRAFPIVVDDEGKE